MQQRRKSTSPMLFTGLAALRLIGLGGLVASAVFWWPVQSELTPNRIVAGAYTAGLVLAPPALWSFVFPWSPGGMLLFKIQRRTVGLWIVFAAALYFLYYSYQLQWSWWSAQPVTAASGMVGQQVCIGLLLYIVIPGLVWTPISRDEFVSQVEQEQLVKRYELQTKADIAIQDARLLRAQQLTAIGLSNLMAHEREELATYMDDLISDMDTTLQRIAGNANEAAEVVYGRYARSPFSAPPLAEDLADILKYIGSSIREVGPAALPAPVRSAVDPTAERSAALRTIERSAAVLPHQEGSRTTAPGDRTGRPVAGDRTTSGPLADQQTTERPHAEAFRVAVNYLTGAWSRADLEGTLSISKTQASDYIRDWIRAGLVVRLTEPKFHYSFEEGV